MFACLSSRARVLIFLWASAAGAGVAGGCDKNESLEQGCSDYAHIDRTRETACYGVAPEPNQSALISRQTRSCVLNSSAPGSHVGASYWSDCASAADNDCGAYHCSYAAGARQDGAPCLTSDQCASLWCKGISVTSSAGSTLPNAVQCGVCASRLTEGTPCDVDTDLCDIGLSCFAGACRLRGASGAACVGWSDCAAPNVCKSNGICAGVSFTGQPCAGTLDCTTDVGCDAVSHLCVPLVFGPPGAACDGDVLRCEAGACDLDTGVCPGVVPDGTACDPTDLSTVCDDYARCFQGFCQIPDPATCG